MKRVLLWVGAVLLTPVVLLLVLTALVYLPPVQDFAVRRAAAYASEATGWDVRLQRLRLTPWLDVDLQGLTVVDAEADTLLAADHALVDLDLGQVWHRRVRVEAVELGAVRVDTKELMASLRLSGSLRRFVLHDDVDLRAHHVQIAAVEAEGLDLDVALRDSTVADEDTTASTFDWRFDVARAEVRDARLSLHLPDTAAVLRADVQLLGLDSVTYDASAAHIALPAILLQLPASTLHASADFDLSAFTPGTDGRLRVWLQTELGMRDVVAAAASFLPPGLDGRLPDTTLVVGLTAEGHVDSLLLTRLEASLPGSLWIDASGTATHLLDSALAADVRFNLRTQDLAWVRPLADGALDGVRLPPMQAGGSLTAAGDVYGLDVLLHEDRGLVALKGQASVADPLTYDLSARVRDLNIAHFLPRDSLGLVCLTARAEGRGTDPLSHATRLRAEAEVQQLQYGRYDLSGIEASATVERGRGRLTLSSDNDLLVARADADALLARQTDLTFSLDLSRADLHALGLVEEPLRVAMCLHADGSTDLRSNHRLEGTVADITLAPGDSIYRPEDIQLQALLRPDTTHLYLASGDLLLTANGRTGTDRLLTQLTHFADELDRQLRDRRIDTDALTRRLPQMDLHLRSGQRNPAQDILHSMGYAFDDLHLDLRLDPAVGINGGARLLALNTGAILLDTIGMHVYQDTTGVRMDARVRNGRRNPQISFDARLAAHLLPSGAGANLIYYDDAGRKGVDLGLVATMEDEGFRVHLDPLDPIIAYRTFHLNDSNYVMLGRGGRVSADVDLLADDGTGLKLYSSPNEDALQDLSVALNHFNLGELMAVLPYAPRLTGFLHGDAHLIQTQENLSVSADLTVDEMTLEGASLGQVGLQAVYLPNADGSHFVDGTLQQTGLPVATFTGSYTPAETDGLLDIDATLERLPFAMADGFIPDAMARLEGVAIGNVHVGGTTARPVVDGEVRTEGLRVLSDPYSLALRVEDDTIRFEQSHLRLDRIQVFSVGQNPFTIDGNVDFADLDKISVDATMRASNFELINAKKTQKAVAYGKVYVDLYAMLRGTLDDLRLLGRLKVLGNTDVTYVLTDSPLSVEDQLADLVEFVDFEDSTYVATEESARPQNINVTMSVQIDDAAQVHCLLSPDASSYVDIEGGGDLMMTYSPDKDLQLSGRYTINSGTLKYTMLVIPLKEFTIKSGSYVEFRGPLMNPALSLAATERVRTTVTENDQPRSVYFDVGLNISQTLENLGLEFTLDAPEDMTLQNELAAMSAEQRGRVAVTMLATGMYLNESGSSGGFSGQNALNSFLQSQISNLTGKALKSVDLSFGVEQGTSASGSTTTDYSFRFAKRFWGNRVSVIVGGKVSSGEEAQNTGETLIDNVSVEYRLDKSATRYVSLFYDKSYESLLDGEVTEMGAGLVLRRKTKKLGELFLFRKKE